MTWDTLSGYVGPGRAGGAADHRRRGQTRSQRQGRPLRRIPCAVGGDDSGSKPPDLDRTTKDKPGRLEVPLRRGGKLVAGVRAHPERDILDGLARSEREDLKKRDGY